MISRRIIPRIIPLIIPPIIPREVRSPRACSLAKARTSLLIRVLLRQSGLWITLASLVSTLPAGAQEAALERIGYVKDDTLHVSLDKVAAAAAIHNEMLASSLAMTDAARAEALAAWSGFLPRIQVGEFFVRSDDPLNSFGFKLNQRDVDPASDFTATALNEPSVAENNITRLQLQQPLFNGGMAYSGRKAASAAARAAEHDHLRATETVAFQAEQAYHGLALAKAHEKVMLGAIAAAEGHARQARAMVAAEMATEADLLQAEVFLSSLRQRLIEVRNLVAVAGENIKLLTAVDTMLPLAPAEPLGDPTGVGLPSLPEAPGLAHRSDMLARRYQRDAAGSMVGVARGTMLPHINLSAEKNFFSREDLFGNDADSWMVGIYGTWDIFAGLQNIGRLKKARAEKRAADHMFDFQLRQARVEATAAWLGAKAAAEKVQVARDAVVAAREGLRIVANQYREGLVSMVDLLDTQAADLMAEGNLVEALHDYNVGLARLRYAGGPVQAAKE